MEFLYIYDQFYYPYAAFHQGSGFTRFLHASLNQCPIGIPLFTPISHFNAVNLIPVTGYICRVTLPPYPCHYDVPLFYTFPSNVMSPPDMLRPPVEVWIFS